MMSLKKKPYHSPYCLHCYAVLNIDAAQANSSDSSLPARRTPAGASLHCEQCGRVSLVVDTHKLWTQERRLVNIEGVLKLAVVLTMVALLALSEVTLAHTPGPMGGDSSSHLYGMAVLAIMLFSLPFWDLASITRKRGRLNGGIVWCAVGVVLGLLFAVALTSQAPGRGPTLGDAAAGLLLIPFLLAPWTRRRWDAWRDQRIAQNQAG